VRRPPPFLACSLTAPPSLTVSLAGVPLRCCLFDTGAGASGHLQAAGLRGSSRRWAEQASHVGPCNRRWWKKAAAGAPTRRRRSLDATGRRRRSAPTPPRPLPPLLIQTSWYALVPLLPNCNPHCLTGRDYSTRSQFFLMVTC
jgi:hypothetical protein